MKKVLQKFGLNPNNSIIIGSGVLQALGVRESKDVDIVATQKIYNSLKKSGKFTISKNHGREILKDDLFEIGISWKVLGKSYRFEDFANDSIVLNGLRYITLDFLYKAKEKLVSDIVDVIIPISPLTYSKVYELIKEYGIEGTAVNTTDLFLGAMLMQYKPNIFLITRDTTDFIQRIFELSSIINVPHSKGIFTYGVYRYK